MSAQVYRVYSRKEDDFCAIVVGNKEIYRSFNVNGWEICRILNALGVQMDGDLISITASQYKKVGRQ